MAMRRTANGAALKAVPLRGALARRSPSMRIVKTAKRRAKYLRFEEAGNENRACRKVVFSDRAYAQIVSETVSRLGTETGGLLVGHYLNGVWYVVEATDPGIDARFEVAYHEGDEAYENHAIRIMSRIYKHPLVFLGMWHRHPGSLDRFSGTDDATNLKYAQIVGLGCVSVIVNLDPGFRMSVYFAEAGDGRLKYSAVEALVGDEHFDNGEVLALASPEKLLSGVVGGKKEKGAVPCKIG